MSRTQAGSTALRPGKSRLLVLVVAPLLLVIAVILLETAFFHVNPIKTGFQRFDFGNCVVYAKGPASDIDFKAIPSIEQKNELSHELHYNSKVQIILCAKQADLARFQPFLSPADKRNAAAVAPWPNTIYLTPKAWQAPGTLDGVLAHELSHILLLQNYGLVKVATLSRRHEWILEGFAVYLSGWPDYFPEDQLSEKAKDAGVEMTSGSLLGTKHAADLPLPIRHMIYRGFVHYLYQRNPSTTVIRFLHDACSNPAKAEDVFKDDFGESLDRYVRAFWKDISGTM